MINIFKAVGDKFVGDLKKLALKKFEEVKAEVVNAAKLMDIDDNGVKDIVQVEQDCEQIKLGVLKAATKLRGIITPVSEAITELQSTVKPGADLLKLGSLYYLKFGPKKPTAVIAQLEADKEAAQVA